MTDNRFYIENERIIKDSDKYITENGYVFSYKSDAEEVCNLLNDLTNENEQLKQQLKRYYNAFDCSQCKYQNYDWFDDGDEFEVCDKGNNEEQMDNHSCADWEEL